VWPFFKRWPASFNVIALSIGAIIPDLECPFLFPFVEDRWHARLVMHSLLGAFTVDLILTVALTLWFVPPFLGWLEPRIENKRLFTFARVDLRTHRTGMAALAGSALLGSVSHVLVDVVHHPFNPLTFPFSRYYDFNLVLFNDLTVSGVIMQGGMLVLLTLMLWFWWLKPARTI
jgi:membrane-bound metal-dependent hydrolase YbcI (DUF457 family)